MLFDVAILGGGIAGLATAARLQAQGLSTVVLEAHRYPGGCAGYFRRRGFAFDVGATTLVDFEPGGVGGELLESIGMPALPAEQLPGYAAWLPDRRVTLHRDPRLWRAERLRALGDTPAHRRFWSVCDRLADAFWRASRAGVKLPLGSVRDVAVAVRALGLLNLPLVRHYGQTMGGLLRRCGLRGDAPLCGLLGMLVEDTVHSTLDDAPLINAALGITIRGAGLTRARGGMAGFWRRFVGHYRGLGGDLRTSTTVRRVDGAAGLFTVRTARGTVCSRQVVGALPADLLARLMPGPVATRLRPFVERDRGARGGAIVVFLGVPEEEVKGVEREVDGEEFTHHQLMQDYRRPFGNGNNMFVSVSAPGDTESAPAGHRAVMISTHCDLEEWRDLGREAYARRKEELTAHLVACARRVYPDLARRPVVRLCGTPRTYERFTRRPDGAVGGVRLTLANSNQHAIPHDLGVEGVRLVGDTTWPGLGTVACVLGSRIAAEGILRWHRTRVSRPSKRSAAIFSRPLPASAAGRSPDPSWASASTSSRWPSAGGGSRRSWSSSSSSRS